MLTGPARRVYPVNPNGTRERIRLYPAADHANQSIRAGPPSPAARHRRSGRIASRGAAGAQAAALR
jgi:hypothetical protein